MKKYELVLDDKRKYADATLYRIRALQDFTCIDGFEVHKGDLGGYIEGEHNLSQGGLSWIRDYGKALNGGKVIEHALVRDYGTVMNYGRIQGVSMVRDYGVACGNSVARDNAIIRGNGVVCRNDIIGKNADIFKPEHILTVGVVDTLSNAVTLQYKPTFYRDIYDEISVICDYFNGYFNGKIDEFSKWVVKEYGDSKHGQAYKQAIRLAKFQIDLG